MALTDIDIINNALGRIAGGRIGALDEETKLARKVVPIFNDIVAVALSAYPWRWARRTRTCQRLDETVENGWTYVHAFPNGMAGNPLAVFDNPRTPDQPLRAFDVEGRKIYSDRAELWTRGLFRMSADQWPDMFRDGVTQWLAAEFTVPLTHDTKTAAELRADAIGVPSEAMRGGRIGRAIAWDVATGGQIENLLAQDPLTDARMSGAPRGPTPWHGDF